MKKKKKLRTQKNNNDNSFPVSFYVCIAYTDRSVHDHNCHIKIKSEEKNDKMNNQTLVLFYVKDQYIFRSP